MKQKYFNGQKSRADKEKVLKTDLKQPFVTLVFPMPDYATDLAWALKGGSAICDLTDIDDKLRSILKHGTPTEEVRELCEEIRKITLPWAYLDEQF